MIGFIFHIECDESNFVIYSICKYNDDPAHQKLRKFYNRKFNFIG